MVERKQVLLNNCCNLLINNVSDVIFEINQNGDFLYVSQKIKDQLGYSSEYFLGENLFNYVLEEDHRLLREEIRKLLRFSKSNKFNYRMRDIKGQVRWFKSCGLIFQDPGGEERVFLISGDVSEIKEYKETIKHQALHDSLTGLSNRNLFSDRLKMELAHTKRKGDKLAVFFLDVDRFKIVNDTLGHGVGDQLLIEVSRRLSYSVREVDTVARLGGDEFTILLPSIRSEDNAAKVAERIIKEIRKPIYVAGHELYLSISIGIVIYPNDGENEETLLKNADTAMYIAKEKGRNNFQLYNPSMNVKALLKLEMENNLRRALEMEEFLLYYQPKVDILTGKIIGVEALLRWIHPGKGMILPMEFMPIAEETGLIVPIGEWVLYNACAQNKAWQDAGYPSIQVAVNISAKQFELQDLVGTIKRVLNKTDLNPHYLELEITETVAMNNCDHTIKVLEQLTHMGIQISIDDFGTGYSSLSYLNKFPISKLKIDKSFIRNIGGNNENEAIASTIIALGKSLSLNVIAEGVENKEQLNFLVNNHCSEMQGFLFSKPLPPGQVLDVFRDRNSRC